MVGGYLSLLYSVSSRPLEYWNKHQSQTGRIRKILDSDLLENVVEIQDFEYSNAASTSIVCPFDPCQLLDIKLPFLVIVIKNLNVECRFKIQIVDNKNVRHHFQFFSMEFDRSANVRDPVICRARVKLETGWNKVELDLRTLTQTAFKCEYNATQRLEICANCRLRRVYFIHRHYADNEISPALCQDFLDVYMLKWGIHLVERATQTDSFIRLKNKVARNKDNVFKMPTNSLVNKDNYVNSKDANFSGSNDILMNSNQRFLRTLQIKSNKLISDFFRRQTHKLPPSTEFRHQVVSKPYVVPAIRYQHSKLLIPEKIWEERVNGLKTLSFHMLNDQRQSENKKLTDITGKWTNRYFSMGSQQEMKRVPHKESVNVEKNDAQVSPNKDNNAKSNLTGETFSPNASSRKTTKKFCNLERNKLKALSDEAFQHNDKYIVDKNQTIHSLTAKRENLIQQTISDLRRTYVNFICTSGNVPREKNDYFRRHVSQQVKK